MSDCQFCNNNRCMICQIELGSDAGVSSMLGRFYESTSDRQNKKNREDCASHRERRRTAKRTPVVRGQWPYAG